MKSPNSNRTTRTKRKAAESGLGDPQPTPSTPKKRKTMRSDPFRAITFDDQRAAPASSSGGPQSSTGQSKKRKARVSDPFRHIAFDGPSSEPESFSGDPQPVQAPTSVKRRKTTKSDNFKHVEFNAAHEKVVKSSQGTPQQGSRPSKPQQKRDFPMEIWGNIMSHCDFRTIQTLESMNSKFASWVEPDSFWTDWKNHYYSKKPPPPAPPGLCERDYADLLDGRGCMKCEKANASKTYWAFGQRWCKACFGASTITLDDVPGDQHSLIQLFGLPASFRAASPDRWGKYHCVMSRPSTASAAPTGPVRNGRPHNAIYLKREVDDISAAVFGRDPVSDYEGRPLVERPGRVAAWTEACAAVEAWEDEKRKRKRVGRQGMEGRRRAFFLERARIELGMEERNVDGSEAFQQAVLIAKEPSMKSWAHLKKKL